MILKQKKSIIYLMIFLSVVSLAAKKEKNPVPVSAPAPSPEDQIEDADKIHAELKQIISRTQELQKQVRDDRSEIQQILARAQIHERILRGISIPKPIQSKQQINADEIIAREKMRLIAQQAYRTQEQLRTIQNSRLVNSVPKTEPAKAS